VNISPALITPSPPSPPILMMMSLFGIPTLPADGGNPAGEALPGKKLSNSILPHGWHPGKKEKDFRRRC
jgi:hypothetical protein